MSNSQKISQMTPASTPLTGAELVPIVQSGVNKQVAVSEIGAINNLQYQGTWNASTNTPTITSSTGTTGYYYIVSVAGNTTIDGTSSWAVGDWIIFSNTGVWQKIGGGTLSSIQIANDTSSSTTYNLAFSTATSGLINTAYVDNIGLVFKPSGTGYADSAFKTKSGKFTGTLVLSPSWSDDSQAFVLGEAYTTNGGTVTMYTPGDSGSFSLEPVAWNKYGYLGLGVNPSYNVPFPLTVTKNFGGATAQVFITESTDQSTNGLKLIHSSGNSTLSTSGSLTFATNSATKAAINTNGALGFGSSPDYGTAGQVLVSQGTGAVPQWTTASILSGISITNDTSSNTDYNLLFTSASSGSVSTQYVDSGALTFNPSSGNLNVNNITVTSGIDFSGGAVNAFYYNAGANRVTMANYNSGGKLVFEVNGGNYTVNFNADGTYQFLNLYNQTVSSSPKYVVVDSGGTLGVSTSAPGAFSYGSFYQNGTTTLTSGIPNSSSTAAIQVADTSGFSASGFLLIGDEIIQYTTKTSTTFDGTITRGVKGTSGSAHSNGSYVTEVAATTTTTAAGMQIDTVVLSSGITCTVPDTKVYFTNAGTYNIQFSAQLLNFGTAEDNVTIWLKVNGSDVSMSAGVVEVLPKHGSSPGAVIATWNYVDTFTAGSYFELYWNAGGNAVLGTYPPGTNPTRPGAPSLILTVTQVA